MSTIVSNPYTFTCDINSLGSTFSGYVLYPSDIDSLPTSDTIIFSAYKSKYWNSNTEFFSEGSSFTIPLNCNVVKCEFYISASRDRSATNFKDYVTIKGYIPYIINCENDNYWLTSYYKGTFSSDSSTRMVETFYMGVVPGKTYKLKSFTDDSHKYTISNHNSWGINFYVYYSAEISKHIVNGVDY